MFDVVISGGTVVDGTGAPAFRADVAIDAGRIVDVARRDPHDPPTSDWEAATTIDATGCLVTPGWVDAHTHYDGQVTWDERLDPSASHGVTTVVTGNCGVGFAPVRPGREEWLIQLMEGVEDIPGAALSEGITWGWESFPQYLDVLAGRRFAMDVATQIAHGAVRGYVMGERGARNEPATPDDVAEMARVVAEALDAGGVGFSTSRTLAHLARDGEPVPGTFADLAELDALAAAVAGADGAVFEVAQGGLTMLDRGSTLDELGWMTDMARTHSLPLSFIVLQTDGDPNQWRSVLEATAEAEVGDGRLYAQVAARPFGMLLSLGTNHPFLKRPSYQAVEHLPIAERAEALRDPARRAAILGEPDGPVDPANAFDGIGPFLGMALDSVYPLGDIPDYEPEADTSVGAVARTSGDDPLSVIYDDLVDGAGASMFLLPLFNYAERDHEAIREMLLAPNAVSSLGDAGAHCGMICDASIPTFLLSHWARDRRRGERLPLELLVHKQTQETALLYGFTDRGVIAAGRRADVNVIDPEAVGLRAPRLVHDLPAGGRRLVQDATGYRATLVAGEVVTRDGVDTGARPGRLVRH